MTSNGDCSNGSRTNEMSEEVAKRDRKTQKRIDKTLEQTLAAAGDIADVQEQLLFVCRKHAESVEDIRKLTSSQRKLELRVEQLTKEKGSLEGEQSRSLLTRSRLEGLCRELQKQNKLIKEESVAKIREEEEKRREVSGKFQTTLSDITGTMHENNAKNTRLTEENQEMSKKLKSLCEQYEQNNSLVEKMMKQKELESQLAEARLAKLQLEMNQEKQMFLQEKQKLLQEMSTYQKRCTDLQISEMSLREQLSTYTEKYDDFQGALAKSNKVFSTFKSEMEKMQKNIRRLEKETGTWKNRWEGSNRSLVAMAEQKQADDAQLTAQRKRIDTLERLCRALQARAAAEPGEAAPGGEGDDAAPGDGPAVAAQSAGSADAARHALATAGGAAGDSAGGAAGEAEVSSSSCPHAELPSRVDSTSDGEPAVSDVTAAAARPAQSAAAHPTAESFPAECSSADSARPPVESSTVTLSPNPAPTELNPAPESAAVESSSSVEPTSTAESSSAVQSSSSTVESSSTALDSSSTVGSSTDVGSSAAAAGTQQ